jgi:hypothetical protein
MNPWLPLLLLIASVAIVTVGMIKRFDITPFVYTPLLLAGALFSFSLALAIVVPAVEEPVHLAFDAAQGKMAATGGGPRDATRLGGVAMGLATGLGSFLLLVGVIRWLRLLARPHPAGESPRDDYDVRLKT